MDDRAYSTTMDALLFLLMISVCAVIMSPVITGHGAERASADRSLRELASSTLVSLEVEKVDYFEYRILGDLADQIASWGNINVTNDYLYGEVTRSVLGRGTRHRTVMGLAAENAACQFVLHIADHPLRLNFLTVEYDRETNLLIEKTIRSRIDQRYGYEFTLRWAPFTGVPLEGSVETGRPHPPGAMSVQTFVTMPYTTNITSEYLQKVNDGDLEAINSSIAAYRIDKDRLKLHSSISQSLEQCLENTTREAVGEIWTNTLGSGRATDERIDPALALGVFSNNETLNGELTPNVASLGEDAIVRIVVESNRESLDAFTTSCMYDIEAGADYPEVLPPILTWLHSRYDPSRARATISVWVGS